MLISLWRQRFRQVGASRRWLFLIGLLPVPLLLVAVLKLPYHLYFVIRTVVCACALFLMAHELRTLRSQWPWAVALGASALILNPVFPLRFHKSTWAVIDIATAALFLTHMAVRQRMLQRAA